MPEDAVRCAVEVPESRLYSKFESFFVFTDLPHGKFRNDKIQTGPRLEAALPTRSTLEQTGGWRLNPAPTPVLRARTGPCGGVSRGRPLGGLGQRGQNAAKDPNRTRRPRPRSGTQGRGARVRVTWFQTANGNAATTVGPGPTPRLRPAPERRSGGIPQ